MLISIVKLVIILIIIIWGGATNWKFMNKNKVKGFIETKPSVVQHIGQSGLFSGGGRYDKAEDFIAEYFFKGKKKGYVFTTRKNKTGYYRDK